MIGPAGNGTTNKKTALVAMKASQRRFFIAFVVAYFSGSSRRIISHCWVCPSSKCSKAAASFSLRL